MITQEKIEEATQRLIKTYSTLKIYIFGSYAWGNPNEDSDSARHPSGDGSIHFSRM